MKALELYNKILEKIKPFQGSHVSDSTINKYILECCQELIPWVGNGSKDTWCTSGDIFVFVTKTNHNMYSKEKMYSYNIKVCKIEKDCLLQFVE